MTIVSRRAWYGLVSLCALTATLLFASAPAFAGKVHVFASTFGTEGSGAGQFKEPSGIAVNEVTLTNTGDVYVVDTGNNRVEYFSPEGKEPKGEITGAGTPAGSFSSPTAIAIDNSADALDPSAGDVYVADFGHSVIDKFDPEGSYLGQITTGAGGEPLGEICGVAVDPAGVVWVYQASKEIDSYSNALSNAFLTSTTSPFEEAIPGFAVDSEEHLYVNKGRFGKISSSGERLINPIGEEEASAGAVDFSTDDLYADQRATIAAFSPTGSRIEQFGEGHLSESQGVAVDAANGIVYASNHEAGTVAVFTTVHTPTVVTGEVTGLASEGSATLTGTVDPEGVEVSSCKFEYGHSSEYGSGAECSPAPGSGESPVNVSAALSGLEIGLYHFRLIAANVNGESVGADHSFIVGSPPTVGAEALVGAGSNTATIRAQVNPNGLATSYRLEYGTSATYGSLSPSASLGAGFSQSGVQINLNGLSPGTVYHARVLAINERGSVKGARDISFTTTVVGGEANVSSCPNRTYSGFSPILPDCRAYEFVSGAAGPGEVYTPAGPGTVPFRNEDIETELAMRAAAAGGGVAYVAEAGSSGGSGASGLGSGNQFLATLDPSQSGWEVLNITPPIAEPEVIPQSPAYEGYSADLSAGVFASNSAALAAAATPRGPSNCQVLYSRSDDGNFHALFTETQTPGHCGSSSILEFGPQNLLFAGTNAGTSSVAANSHLLFQSPAPLTPGTQASTEEGKGTNLYESIGGVARLVSVLPGGEADANAVFGGAPSGPDIFSLTRPNFANAISADGSRIFWTDLGSGQVYMRVNGTSTVAVSTGAATYWGASTDGRYVFYTEGGALWRFDAQGGGREDLAGASVAVQGVPGVSEDGSYVYFVAEGALTTDAESRNCREAKSEKEEKRDKGELTPEEAERLNNEEGQEQRGHLPTGRGCNLYLRHGGETRLVAALSAQDDRLIRSRSGEIIYLGVWQGELGSRTAQVADGGRELVFQSTQQLTGYDNSNLDEANGRAFGVEVFVYEAGSGQLTCASCDPSGTPPAAEVIGVGSGTYLPVSLSPTFMRRWVSADGSRVFFASSQPLASQDTNQAQDVYEWERAGTEGCPVGNGGGCISLLSGGDSTDQSFFVDASADGNDVFFTHRGQLGGVGTADAHAGLFDVRVGGGFAESSTACTGTGCQGVAPAPPSFATPPSATFTGGGNYSPLGKGVTRPLTRSRLLAKALKTCKQKKPKSNRVACEGRARKRYGSVKAKAKQHKKAKKSSKHSSNGGKR